VGQNAADVGQLQPQVIIKSRGGPQWLDSSGADLRWKPPAIMPPVFPGNLP